MSVAAALSIVVGAAPAAAQDAAAGAVVFKKCSVCHATSAGKASSMGPHLGGIVGRKAGSAPNYVYSKAMASAGFRWDAAKLDAYLTKPQVMVKGTKMGFGGLSNPKDRQDVIAYLATLK